VRLGVFGGSFDPPHVGHVAVCAMTLALVEVDELLVVPCFEHALGKGISASFDHRLAMCERAISDLQRTGVTDVERTLGGTSFTLRTLEHLAASHPGATLCLVVGADALRDRGSWHRFDEIERLADVVVFGRVGVELGQPTLPAPPGVSASDIRDRLARGESVDGLVPVEVLRYIARHGLYR
jgi:nicotinate-nucleotide adenylyltransferase